MTKLGDMKIGDKILVHYAPSGKWILALPTPGSILIPAIVLENNIGMTTIGWSSGQIYPIDKFKVAQPLKQNWIDIGIVVAHSYGDHCDCLLDGNPSKINVATKSPLEKACKNPTCKHMNDVGSSKCWWCETKNPTA